MEKNFENTLPLLDAPYGVSGDEEAVAAALLTAMEGLYDEHFEDALGNQFFLKKGKSDKTIVLCAHMDEIGFIVSNILDNGQVKILPVGFHDDRVCINQKLALLTEQGVVTGITGSVPFHALDHSEEAKPTKISDLIVDVGAFSKEETEKLGIQLGDKVAFFSNGEFLNNGKIYSGKSVDDRSGCAMLVETFRAIKDMDLDISVYAVGTTQEEIGMRGGGVVANRLQPDLLLAIDVTLAKGLAGMEDITTVELGKGPCVKYYDWDTMSGMVGNTVPKKLTKLLCDTAKNAEIPFQKEVMVGGGTDAWSASIAGIGYLCGGVSIPSQYIHTAVGTVHLDDLVNGTRLLVELIKNY